MVARFAKGKALAAIIRSHTCKDFLSEIDGGITGGEGKSV